MRFIFVAALVLALNQALSGAEIQSPIDKFYELGTGCDYENGTLKIYLYEYSITWLNGVRQGDEDYELNLKPGDVVDCLVCGDRDRFVRYRLDRLTPTRAYFTRWIFSAVRTELGENSWKYREGSLQLTEKFEVDLTQPNGLLVDYGPEHVVSSGQKTVRSK